MTIAFLLYPGVTALDVVGPYEVLHPLEKVDIVFVGQQVGPVVTDSGVLVLGVTHTCEDVPQPDVLIVPGSAANTATAAADRSLVRYVQRAHATSRFTASVCSGALILGAAGVLNGLPATTHWFGIDKLEWFGAQPRPEERVVRSGKVITAAGVSAGIDMALALAVEIAGEQAAKVEQLWIEYDPQPPFEAGHVSKADAGTVERARQAARLRSRNVRDVLSVPTVLARRWYDALTGARLFHSR